jgi:hypothetical protein
LIRRSKTISSRQLSESFQVHDIQCTIHHYSFKRYTWYGMAIPWASPAKIPVSRIGSLRLQRGNHTLVYIRMVRHVNRDLRVSSNPCVQSELDWPLIKYLICIDKDYFVQVKWEQHVKE